MTKEKKPKKEFQNALLEIRKKTKLKSDKNFLAQFDFQKNNELLTAHRRNWRLGGKMKLCVPIIIGIFGGRQFCALN